MNETTTDANSEIEPGRVVVKPGDVSWKRSQRLSWAGTAIVLVGLGTYLALARPPGMGTVAKSQPPAVEVTPEGRLRLPDAPAFERRLQRVNIATSRTSAPILDVTGTLMAAVATDGAQSSASWQFATGELLTTYAEWSQSEADVTFRAKALASTRALHDARVAAQTKVVERLEKLVEVGSDSARDLALEEANLRQTRLEGEKSLHEADSELRAAQRKQTALARQLEQAGLAPDLLRQRERGNALLVAEIPESRIDRVRAGIGVVARFYGRPNTPLSGKVARILPTVSPAQRTLRVVVLLDDADHTLRPGMFADVGLGTDERGSVLVPSEGVLHIGRSDYVLVSSGPKELEIREVVVGDTRGSDVEVIDGLDHDKTVIGQGAILLKAFVIDSLARKAAR